jgi:hypothetical protein
MMFKLENGKSKHSANIYRPYSATWPQRQFLSPFLLNYQMRFRHAPSASTLIPAY